jgi:hypothetical protein
MVKYDLLVYLGLIPIVSAFIFGAFVIWATPASVSLEIRRIRLADGMLCGLLALFIFAAILYFVDAGGAGKEIFDKSSTAILALLGTIMGYIFGTTKA